MKWSKIRKELKERLTEPLKDRLDYHLTTYQNSSGYMGRAWITIDGKEILNFSNQDTWSSFDSYSNELAETHYISHKPLDMIDRGEDNLMEKGEFSKYDFGESTYKFLNLDIQTALQSKNPILRVFAVVDRRTGKRTIDKMSETENHPMVKYLIDLRKEKKPRTI